MEIYFSIIVPAYNTRRYIAECLESVMAQQYEHWELVVLDDGSTDDTWEVITRYAAHEPRIRCVRNANHGVSYTRNVGLEQAQGQFIVFLDSDDILQKGALLRFAKVISEHDPDFILFGYQTYGLSSNAHTPTKECLYHDLTELEKSEFLPYNMAGGVYKKSLIEEHRLRFSEDITHAEDQEFVYKYMILCDTYYTIPESYYGYRVHAGSASSQLTAYHPQAIKCHLIVAWNLIQFFRQLPDDLNKRPWMIPLVRLLIKRYLSLLLNVPADKKELFQKEYCSFYQKVQHIDPSILGLWTFKLAAYYLDAYLFMLKTYIALQCLRKSKHLL